MYMRQVRKDLRPCRDTEKNDDDQKSRLYYKHCRVEEVKGED